MGYIGQSRLLELAGALKKSGYGTYLEGLASTESFPVVAAPELVPGRADDLLAAK